MAQKIHFKASVVDQDRERVIKDKGVAHDEQIPRAQEAADGTVVQLDGEHYFWLVESARVSFRVHALEL